MSLINFQSKLKNAIHKNDLGMATIIATAHHWLGHRLGHVHAACKAWLLAFVCMFLHEHLQRVSAQYFSCPQHAACVHNNLVLEHSNIAVRATDRVDDD